MSLLLGSWPRSHHSEIMKQARASKASFIAAKGCAMGLPVGSALVSRKLAELELIFVCPFSLAGTLVV